jgi:glycosyltransferase involved in cell wall biosynthesis
MGSNKKKTSTTKKQLPFVSVCTPTFNRRPFIENMFQCFRNQTYPKHRIEWIIVDDGTDKIKDMVEKSNIPQIRYFEVAEKMTLGAKRNYMHKFVRGSIIVYMDDDDYYPPERIEDAVEKLEANPQALAGGSSEIYIYFKHIQKMYKCGPYNPNHATAGTFAFRTELLKMTKYEEGAAVAEERAFLKDYTIPFVQFDPMKAILVFSHNHNTFDKRKMLDNPHPDFFRECNKTVEEFIRKPEEKPIYDFFMNQIDGLLENYEPGHPKMKPDVLKQIKEIEEQREKMVKEEMAKQQAAGGQIMLQQPGKPPMVLNNQQIVEVIQQQQQQLQLLGQKAEEYERMIQTLQGQLVEKTKTIRDLNALTTSGSSASAAPSHTATDNVRIEISEPASAAKVSELEGMVVTLQKQLIEKTKTIRELKAAGTSESGSNSSTDLQGIVSMLQGQLIEKTKEVKELKALQVGQGANAANAKLITELQSRLLQKDLELQAVKVNTPNRINEDKEKMGRLEALATNLQRELLEKNAECAELRNQTVTAAAPAPSNENNEKMVRLETLATNLQQRLLEKNAECNELAARLEQQTVTAVAPMPSIEIIEKINRLETLATNLQRQLLDKNMECNDLTSKFSDLTKNYYEVSNRYSSATVKIAELNNQLFNAVHGSTGPAAAPPPPPVNNFTRIPIEEVSSNEPKKKSDPEVFVNAAD